MQKNKLKCQVVIKIQGNETGSTGLLYMKLFLRYCKNKKVLGNTQICFFKLFNHMTPISYNWYSRAHGLWKSLWIKYYKVPVSFPFSCAHENIDWTLLSRFLEDWQSPRVTDAVTPRTPKLVLTPARKAVAVPALSPTWWSVLYVWRTKYKSVRPAFGHERMLNYTWYLYNFTWWCYYIWYTWNRCVYACHFWLTMKRC